MEQKKVIRKKVEVKVTKETFIDKLKKNWKNIVLILLVLFSFSKCTSSCSRGKQIDRLNYQIEVRDSIINANGIELDKLNTRLGDAQTSIDSYKGIATGNQQALVEQVQTLTVENRDLKEKNRRLNSDNTKLSNKVKELEETISSLSKTE